MDIPDDIWQLAHEVCDHCEGPEGEEIYSASEKAVARAILAERKRCAQQVDLIGHRDWGIGGPQAAWYVRDALRQALEAIEGGR